MVGTTKWSVNRPLEKRNIEDSPTGNTLISTTPNLSSSKSPFSPPTTKPLPVYPTSSSRMRNWIPLITSRYAKYSHRGRKRLMRGRSCGGCLQGTWTSRLPPRTILKRARRMYFGPLLANTATRRVLRQILGSRTSERLLSDWFFKDNFEKMISKNLSTFELYW